MRAESVQLEGYLHCAGISLLRDVKSTSVITNWNIAFLGSLCARTPSRTPGIVKGNIPLSLVWFK